MCLVVSDFMAADQSGFAFRQILIEKNAAVSFNDLVEPFQIADFAVVVNLNAETYCNDKGVACLKAPDKFFADFGVRKGGESDVRCRRTADMAVRCPLRSNLRKRKSILS